MSPPPSRSANVAVLIAVAVHGALWLPLLAEVLVYFPVYERYFAKFQMKMPALTEWVVGSLRFFGAFPFVLPAFVLVMLVIDGFVYRWLRQKVNSPILSEIWYAMMIAFPLATTVYCELALRLATIKLLEGLSR